MIARAKLAVIQRMRRLNIAAVSVCNGTAALCWLQWPGCPCRSAETQNTQSLNHAQIAGELLTKEQLVPEIGALMMVGGGGGAEDGMHGGERQ